MADRQSLLTYRTSDVSQHEKIEQNQQKILSQELSQQPKSPPKQRLNSLDVHRGLTMMGMILVDCSGQSPPWPINHTQWNGLSTADLIFPSFVFIMGMAVPLAMSSNRPFKLKNLFRIVALFGIGLILNILDCQFNFSQLRILGVLQRLSVCYGLISLVHVLTNYGQKNLRFIGTLLSIGAGIIYVVFMVNFTNQQMKCTRDNNLTPNCNFGSYVDRKIFGDKHLYEGGPNDPEGLFTDISAYLNAYLDNKNQLKKILSLWVIFGLLLLAVVYPLTILMPLNKKIWSISFVFLTCGVAGLTLAFLTFTIDYLTQKYTDTLYSKIIAIISKPFIFLGRNPLAIYILMMASQSVMNWISINGMSLWDQFYYKAFESWISNKQIASTIYAVFYLIVWIIVGWGMFRKEIFIRL